MREMGAYGVEILGVAELPPGDDILGAPGGDASSGAALYLPRSEGEAARARLAELCRRRVEPYFGPVALSLAPAPAVDWIAAYRAGVRAMQVAPGLWVEPPWDSARPQPGDLVLRIDPGGAFGYGDHASTRTCLALVLQRVRPQQDVIDFGSGSGILGAAALLRGAGRLRAYDLDPLAVQATRRTLCRNGLGGAVRQGPLPRRGRGADLILANISGQGLRPWLGLLRRRLNPGGELILGGILREDLGFDEALGRAGLVALATAEEGDWRAIAAAPA